MKRVIKFRAYTEISNEVLGMKYDVPHNYNDTVMQFTGLLDRNGKEIYDGDIVHFNTLGGNNMYYEVKWSDAKTGFKPTRLTKTNQAEIEIIGNIYSDPHLLTDWRIRRSILIPNKNKSK